MKKNDFKWWMGRSVSKAEKASVGTAVPRFCQNLPEGVWHREYCRVSDGAGSGRRRTEVKICRRGSEEKKGDDAGGWRSKRCVRRCRGYDRMLEKSGVRKRVEKRRKTDGAESEG